MRFPTTTPRLGGSPPTTLTTGYPWADGEILYAADLNAAFVPISGGTMTGPLGITETNSSMPAASVDQFNITRNVNWSGGNPIGYYVQHNVLNVNGDASLESPVGDFYPILVQTYVNGALRNTLADTNNSGGVGITSQIERYPPPAGIPDGRRLRDAFAYWGTFNDHSNAPTSHTGVLVDVEYDNWYNHVDNAGSRILTQVNSLLSIPLASGGYPASVRTAMQLEGYGVWGQDWLQIGGSFNHSAINLYYADSYAPIITSATPGSPTRVVTVDNIMPLEGGGNSGFSDFQTASTYAEVRTCVTVTGTTELVVNDAANLYPVISGDSFQMYVYDTLSPSGIPDRTYVVSGTGNTLTLSSSVTVAAGATVIFARARKSVKINGNGYTVAGVVFSGPGTTAGTVYFTSPVTVADATNGAVIYPNNHAIWLRGGSATAPWRDICFDEYGSATIRSDGSFGLMITGEDVTVQSGLTAQGGQLVAEWNGGSWSSSNWGKQLLIQSHVPGADNPAICIADSTGDDLIGICNLGGGLGIAAMPALTNGTTPPVVLLQLTNTGGLQLGTGSWSANGTISVSLTAVAPAGAHATVQEWLTIVDGTGQTRYIPAF